MKLIYIIICLFILSKDGFSQNLFQTNEHFLKFNSNNITLVKEKKINEIKIKSFKKILTNILTQDDIKIINTNDIFFINNFILNIKINNEKIINNNYFSEVSINYDKKLITEYLIKKKIGFVDYLPDNFLLIILEQDSIKYNLLSKENNFYKHLTSINKSNTKDFFLMPNLDHNDRFIYDKNNFLNDTFFQNNKLNNKYGTTYQVLIHSIKKNGFFENKVFLYFDNEKHLAYENKSHIMNYNNFFNQLKLNILDKWIELNKIDTKNLNFLNCKININNISELSYVRNKLKTNIIVKNFNLKTIKLNENTYQISFFGNINIFINSLLRDRMKLFMVDNSCNIKLI